jgi:aminodeoxyfutalosine deaminase
VTGPPYPKIELHVHFEATVAPATLIALARRNGVALPADTVEGLAPLYAFTDFPHFIETWIATTQALRTAEDFRQVVVGYAGRARRMGAVYIEGIFSPAERVIRGTPWQEVFEGYCDGAQEARERHGVEVRLTPDVTRGFSLELAQQTARWAARYRERGVVGLGLGGDEAQFPPEPYAPAFALARAAGLGSVPHAGEVAGPASIRGALDELGADRLRHGIRAVDDPGLLRELAERGVVLDVTPISNLRTGVVASLADHPLPKLLSAGIPCSISTDDPELMDTDLERDCAAAESLGLRPREMFAAGLRGALCDDATRAWLQAIGDAHDWAAANGRPAREKG